MHANGTVEVYVNGSLLATRSITAWPYYASSGYIGLWTITANNELFDNFGGGACTTACQGLGPQMQLALTAPHSITKSFSSISQLMVTMSVPAGQVWRTYYYENSQRVAYRESTSSGSTLYYLFSDHLGSTLLVTDSGLNPVTVLRYNDFGSIRYSSGTVAGPNAFTYTGQRQEGYINLMWYGSRWYDLG